MVVCSATKSCERRAVGDAIWFMTGLGAGLCFGLEVARRAFRDTAMRLERSNEILSDAIKRVERVETHIATAIRSQNDDR